MNISRFEKFDAAIAENLPDTIDKILDLKRKKKYCAVGFITTDDFYGFYLSWKYTYKIDEFYDWRNGINPTFLYQPLVDIVDTSKDINLLERSDEKWEFAKAVLAVLEKNIKALPDEVFTKNGYNREDVLFFATMSDGDYIGEMLDESVKMFNSADTLKKYRL